MKRQGKWDQSHRGRLGSSSLEAHNVFWILLLLLLASVIDKEASFLFKKEAGSVNTVPYAGRYGLDGRFYVEEIKLKSRSNKTFVAKL